MKTTIKIVLALILLTAIAQAGMAAMTNYQYQDEVHEALIFQPNATDQEITNTAVELARKIGLPVTADNVTVRQVGPDLLVDITYELEVPLLPGFYSHPWEFNPSTSTRLLPGVRRSPIR